ncbi:hypothetical protein SBOR_8581 [Sclerotinia borealis F-4128]|uniref:Uncharacterized protein n=1 Tax=Sclerotinia borealis (strain F-4128) TaxID=1432307 RepID=W9C845_SCLBF|nr:hypothetical protein SBOR_8581 [Sclerotinia borealis F-4128]
MAYNAIDQTDHDKHHDGDHDLDSTSSNSPFQRLSPLNHLFLDAQNSDTSHSQTYSPENPNSLSQMVKSITSKSTKSSGSYDILEDDEYDEHEREQKPPSLALSPERKNVTSRDGSPPEQPLVLSIPRPRPRQNTTTVLSNNTTSPISPRAILLKERVPIVRTASGHSISLRHPTPDLQTLQGAYIGNIDKLERTAERLSMTTSIDDAIRELHMEQKRSDSRRSSILSQLNEMPHVSREVSNPGSIIELNNAARSGGYSPAGYMMSPKGSFSITTRGRSASKSSRFGNRPEPEMEGRPLDSFVNISFPSLVDHRTPSIVEQDERSATLTRPAVDKLDTENKPEHIPDQADESRPQTSASTNTYDHERMFADFDGVHSAPLRTSFDHDLIMGDHRRTASRTADSGIYQDQRRFSSGTQLLVNDNDQRKMASENRQSMIRPQSYADPSTGQQMVYYPARVPMMLNLPQKLSKNPSSMARNKRRSEVLSNIPAAARQSAVWLPDVLETNGGPLPENDDAQNLEYIPQHQRMSMGGRRNTQDLEHMPAHLRANVFFELPQGQSGVVELKEQSAVATLDSILDASAHAPVTAFVDHAIAGHLGSEVYGKPHQRTKSNTQLLTPVKQDKQDNAKKRTSSFNFLLGRRANSSALLGDNENRASTMSNIQVERKATRSPIEDDEDDIHKQDTTPLRHSRAVSGATDLIRAEEGEVESEEDEGQRDDEVYHGPPTTLLAELQLRKQQQKIRTRPPVSVNGMQSTLLEMDTVLERQQKSRKQKQVNLAWQIGNNDDPEAEDDEDVPLAMLDVTRSQAQEMHRPLGLMERRDLEDNEPLSRRRARLTGQPMPMPRATTMMHIPTGSPVVEEEEGETLAQRIRRLKEQGGTATGLPATRPVSGDFASEMMSQFGGDLMNDDGKGKEKEVSTTPVNEEEETLGQRRKRLHAEREAREKEVGTAGEAEVEAEAVPEPLVINKMNSMADILSSHPAAGASRNAPLTKSSRPVTGLLGLHEKQTQRRASTMTNLVTQQNSAPRASHGNRASSGTHNDPHSQGQPGMIRPPQTSNYNLHNSALPNSGYPQFAQPTSMNYNGFNNPTMMQYGNAYPNMGYQNTMPVGGYNHMMPMQMQMQNIHTNPVTGLPTGPGGEPLNQGQLDMVERWRQSVMH